MRSVLGVVAFVCLGLALAGCDPSRDARYFREGIGTDLYWDGLPAATQLQDVYLANICAQAISPTARSIDSGGCEGLPLTPRNWGLLVQAGMNDIDLRCDAYLAWLYDRKTSKEPFLKELAVLGGATAAILRASEVSATPIALTAIAFGLAADTFTNFDARLVNAVDYSTAGSVVRDNRTKFRVDNLNVVIDNRPAAIYILRSYLSICVPDTIEMSINNTLAVFHRAGPEALRVPSIALRTSAATATTNTSAAVRGGPVIRADAPPPPPPPVKTSPLNPISDIEKRSVTFDELKGFQRMLCIPETGDFGRSKSETRIALKAFFEAQYYPQDSFAPETIEKDADLRRLRTAQAVFPSCAALGFSSAFEVGIFARPPNTTTSVVDAMKNVSDIVTAAGKKSVKVSDALRGSAFGPAVVAELREVIPKLRTEYSLSAGNAIDRALYDRIVKTNAGLPLPAGGQQ